ncbi:MAG: AmmeMemoRadiSam system radical SAM enzyme, partial [Fidelibacterota bacterium]
VGCALAAGLSGLISYKRAEAGLYSGWDFRIADDQKLTPARFYEKLQFKKVKCTLCPRECVVDDQERGYCGVRENREGAYYTLVHSRPCSIHIDPIEKKPLFHFLPGTQALSLATAGCNVNCKFCQNWQISQVRPEQTKNMDVPPEKIADLAVSRNSPTIAYTYTEPVIFAEYVYDCAAVSRERGRRNVIITNAYIEPKPMEKLCEVLDAVKVDLKAYTEKFYREVVIGTLQPVLDILELLIKINMWTEIVYLVIPTLNDDENDIKAMCKWIKETLGPDIPLHFTRFYPMYQIKNLPPTPVSTLEMAKSIADSEGINYVYVGNVPGHPAESTYCPRCKNVVIGRIGFFVKEINLKDGKCTFCEYPIPGVWV